jgi:hypothetical protein
MTSYMGQLTHGVGACHVEICMPHADGFMISSIYNGENVNVTTTKTFANPNYTVHTLMVNDKQLENMKKTVLTISSRYALPLQWRQHCEQMVQSWDKEDPIF